MTQKHQTGTEPPTVGEKPYSRDSFLAAYQRLKTLRAACEETGCPPYVGYRWAKIAGVMTSTDGQQYGTKGSRLGATAEAEFHRLVPEALHANRELEANCPSFDFDVRGILVDIKYSSIRPSSGAWSFKTGIKKPLPPDFYACFFATSPSGNLSDGYRLFLIPHEVIGGRTNLTLRPDSVASDWLHFEVNPAQLRKAFTEMATEI